MTRREMMQGAAALLPLAAARAEAAHMPNMGGAPAGFPARSRAAREAGKPFDFVAYCHEQGFGVVETRLPSTDAAAIRQFRDRLETWQMRAIIDVPLPRTDADLPAYEANVKAAADAGAVSMHAAMTQRRYEQFDTLAAFRQDFERCQAIIARSEPVLRKNRMRLGIENHKGWRSAEQAAWLRRVSSEWVGVHFDFGNNISLCEDPKDTLHNLLPFIVACHLKDMSVQEYEDGFLLSEMPLGEGILDLPAMVTAIRAKDPKAPFDLEMITRDPLKIPVYTDKYWATFDDTYSPLPGRDLAHTLNLVRKQKPKTPLIQTTGLSADAYLQLEDECVRKSIDYARQHLSL
jgi:3-oxoisoapionate decarboxylase